MDPNEKSKGHPLKKFVSLFIKADYPTVKENFVMNVMVPKITEMFVDGIRETAEMIFYGQTTTKPGRSKSGTYISYNNFSNTKKTAPQVEQRENLYHPEADVPFPTYYDADELKDILLEMISVNHNVTVAEFYREANQILEDPVRVPNDYMNERYGWTDLSEAKVVRRSGDYYLSLPRCRELKLK